MEVEPINWGTLSQIPEICINRFGGSHTKYNNNEVDWVLNRAFFLTHCDYITLDDLLNSNFLIGLEMNHHDGNNSMKLYLHQMSYEFLFYWITTKYVKNSKEVFHRLIKLKIENKIIFLNKNIPIQLEFDRIIKKNNKMTVETAHFQVTTLSAGYDVGSIMLMFESISTSNKSLISPFKLDNNLRILFTGNCRVHLNDLKSTKSFYHLDSAANGIGGHLKHFTHLYLDTKYFTEYIQELPSRKTVTDRLIKTIDIGLHKNKYLIIGFRTTFKIANLHFFQTLLSITEEQSIHVPTNLYVYFQKFPVLQTMSKIKSTSAKFHYDCDGWEASERKELCFPAGDIWRHKKKHSRMTQISLGCDMWNPKRKFGEATRDEISWIGHGYEIYTKNEEGKHYETLHGIYSSQLSRYEAIRLIKFLGVDIHSIYPLYKGKSVTLVEMKNLIENSCLYENADIEPEIYANDYPSHFHDFTDELVHHHNSAEQ